MKPKTRYRCAITGRFVSQKESQRRKRTTVQETIKPRPRKRAH